MATNFPNSLDNGTSLPYPSSSNLTNSPSLASGQDNQNDSLIAIQNKLGITTSTPTASNLLVGTGVGTSSWTKLAPTGAIVGTTDTQNLSNKTLLSATITSPIITNATLTTDVVSGFTTPNSGSIYGVPIVASSLSGNSITNGSIAGSKLGLTINSQANTGSAGGTLNYINIGGLKLLWISIVNAVSSTTYSINFPAGFFTVAQSCTFGVNGSAGSTTGLYIIISSLTSSGFNYFSGTNAQSGTSFFVVGI